MRTLLIGGALGALVIALSGCGGSNATSGEARAAERRVDLYEISQTREVLPRGDIQEGHRPTGQPVRTPCDGHFRPGKDRDADKEQIRQVWLKSKAFKPETHWLSDHPAYKLKVTVDGDRGTLHFECHFIDVETAKVAAVTAGNLDVARIDSRWLITNFVGSTSELTI